MVKAIDLGIANLQQKFFQSIQQENILKKYFNDWWIQIKISI